MDSNYRYFKLTEISSARALVPFAIAKIEVEKDACSYVAFGNDIVIRLDVDKSAIFEIDVILADIIRRCNNDQEDN